MLATGGFEYALAATGLSTGRGAREARSDRIEAGWVGDGAEVTLDATSGQRSVPTGQTRKLRSGARAPAITPVVLPLKRIPAPVPFVHTPVGSTGHCVSNGGHSVMTTGHSVCTGGQRVGMSGQTVSCVAGHCVAIGGHSVVIGGHCVCTGGQYVSEPGEAQ